MHRYLEARTAFFDAVVVEALDAGLRQVVVLGAGYDARSLRYARDGVRFFEVDLARTQDDKLDRLARLKAQSAEVAYLAADFATDPIDGLLTHAGLDAGSPTLFVLEGVVPYLDCDVLSALLVMLRGVAADGSRFALSVGVERSDDDVGAAERAREFRARVGSVGEPVLTSLGPSEGCALLGRCGWEVDDTLAVRIDEALASRRRTLGLLLARAGAAR